MFFLENHGVKEVLRMVAYLFLFFKKTLYEVNASGLQLGFNIFR